MKNKLLHNKNFMFYILGRLISLIGNGVLMLAMPLYVLDLTGKGTMMGLFGMLSLLPALAVMPLAGVIGDRMNRKHIMVLMDFLNGILLLIILIITKSGVSNIYFLMGFTVLLSIFSAMFNASTSAMLPDLVEKDELAKATSIRSVVNSLSFIIGPLLGGMLYGFLGIELIFFIDGISFILSALSEMAINYVPKHNLEKKENSNVGKEIVEGFSFIYRHKNLRMLLIYAWVTNLLITPVFSVVYPFIMRQEIGFSAQSYAFFDTAFVVGMLVGNLVFVAKFSKTDTKKLMKTGLAVETALMVVAAGMFIPFVVNIFGGATISFLALLISVALLFGFSNVYVNVPFETNIQKMVPAEIRSRVFSALGIISQGGVPLSTLLIGVLIDYFKGYQISMAVIGICFAITIWFLIKAPDSLYRAELDEEKESKEVLEAI